MNPLASIVRFYLRFPYLRQFIWSLVIVIVAGVIAAVLMTSGDVSTMPVGWEKSLYISPYNIKAKNLKAVSRGNYVIAAYEGREAGKTGIYASISFTGGDKYLVPVKIAEIREGFDSNPYPAVSSNGAITVMWQNMEEATTVSRIFFSTSTDFGATWTKPEQIFIGYEMEIIPRAFYDARNTLHLFFQAYRAGEFNIFHSMSFDGSKFQEPRPLINLKEKMRGAFSPAIYFDGSFIGVVWQGKADNFNDDLFFIKSGNFGRNWSSSQKITASRGSNSSPDIVIHDGTVYLAYQNNDTKNWTIKLLKGEKEGSRWDEQPITVSQTNANCYQPKVTYSNGELMFTWHDSRDKVSGVFFKKYSIRENTFTQEVKLSSGTVAARNASEIISGGRISLIWVEGERIIAKSNDISVDPPVVFSLTHPVGAWSRSSVAEIQWRPPQDESGIAGYSSIVNKLPDFNPTVQNQSAVITKEKVTGLDDGVTYFHIRAIDGAGNMSRTVHYKLQTSMNPLPMPVIVSPTHPEGEPSAAAKALFKWTVDDVERLKGFVYRLSKDVRKRPDRFTTDFEMNFEGLAPGGYFLTLSAIDMANHISNEATYNFIVGKKSDVSDDYMKTIEGGGKEEALPVVKIPSVGLLFKFDTAKDYDRGDFDAIIDTRNIQRQQIAGYSVVVSADRTEPPDRINLKPGTNILSVKDLKSGDYHIGIKCRYFDLADGKKIFKWTAPYFVKIRIRIPDVYSPIRRYVKMFMEKLSEKNELVTIIILSLLAAIIAGGIGRKLIFFTRLLAFRVGTNLRLMAAWFGSGWDE